MDDIRGKELSKQNDLETLRQPEHADWSDIAHLTAPDSDNFDDLRTERSGRDDDDVVDSTGRYAVDNFVGGLFGQAVNPATRWMELGLDDSDLAKWKPVKKYLYGAANIIYRSLSPSVSTFYENVPPWMGDMGRFGNGFLGQEEWVGHNFIIDQAFPVAECWMDVDAAGRLEVFSRKFLRSANQIRARYKDNPPALLDEKKKYMLVQMQYPNPDFRAGALGVKGMPILSCTVSEDIKGWRYEKGFNEMPAHLLQWNRRSGRAWASGPGHDARPDMNMLQEMERSDLIASQFDAEPVTLLGEESAITRADLVPAAALQGAMLDDKPTVQYLERRSNFNRTGQKAEQRRRAIHQAFRFGLEQVIDRPEMTRAEFMGWQEQDLVRAAPHTIRVQAGLASFIQRRFRILQRAGQFDAILGPMPQELAGRILAVDFVSPLAKAQKLATGRANMQWVAALGELAQYKPNVMDKLNADALADELHDTISAGSPSIIYDDREVDAIRTARAEAQAKQIELDQTAQATEIMATASHAAQAQTLARRRAVQ